MDSIYYKYIKKIKVNPTFMFILIIYILPNSLYSQELEGKVIGYYPYWLRSAIPANKIKFENLTHINHAFAWPNADGSIHTPSNIPDSDLIIATHSAGKKVLIALGGYGTAPTAGFVAMASDSLTRAIFINNIIDFILENEYDGIDLDWEFPKNSTEKSNYTKFVEELRQEMDTIDDSWLLTMPVNPGNWVGQWLDYPALEKHIDWFMCMAYDFHGGWTNHAGHNAPLYAPNDTQHGSGDDGIKYLMSRGIPKEKLLFGLPFYAKPFNASGLYASSTGGGTQLRYNEVSPLINSGWNYHWDDVSKVPYLIKSDETQFMTFDDSISMSVKTEYARREGLAGVMIWALGQDVIGDSQPLLESIGKAMRAPLTSVDVSTNETITTFQLFDNYPNPFNGSTIIEFYLPKDQNIELSIYNALGQQVAILRKGFIGAGKQSILWNAAGVPGGAYFYILKAGSFTETKKMIYIR